MALVIAAVIVAVVVASAFYSYQVSTPTREITELTWQRTGGFIGLSGELVIQPDGSASYTSSQFGDRELVLIEDEIEGLLSLVDKANFFTLESAYAAKSNVADYFSYRLTVQTTSDAKTVEWVESWASEKTIPSGLGEVQLYIETVIERIHQTRAPAS